MSFKSTFTLLGTAAMLSMAFPIQATALAGGRPGDLTQAEYLQWLAKASAKKANLSANASTADLVKWAVARGIMPEGGWKPEAPLTRDVYARTLAQVYGVSSAADPVRALQREGVMVPNTRLISREIVLKELGDPGFHSITAQESRHPATPIDHDPKEVICHNRQAIVIAHSAYPAHAAHGDRLGACQPDPRDDKGKKDDKKGGDH
jgi:hypothetical protein